MEQCASGRQFVLKLFYFCGLGAVYCQILDSIRPGSVCMRKVRWDARFEYEFLPNYKLLQKGFVSAGISRDIEVDRLIKGRYQDNLEMCQFLMYCYHREPSTLAYDPISRRVCSKCKTFPDWAATENICSVPTTRASTAQLPSTPCSPRVLYLAERERDFYLAKLEKIEAVCKASDSNVGLSGQILELMYSMADINAFVAT